ncbi:MAG: hypothetical protein QOJ17_5073, partial [Rhodospirillaceae bacterium]|nr:hypothetical protein [Rhodospirillaceae bacterium]
MGLAMALMGLAGACGELGQPDIAQPPVLGQRQDVLIPSNEATMSRMPMILPTPQKT